jgi:hypothetical protein
MIASHSSRKKTVLGTSATLLLSSFVALSGCTTNKYYEQTYVIAEDDAGHAAPDDDDVDAGVVQPEPEADAGGQDAGPQTAFEGAPLPDTIPEDLALDIYGTVGNHYWFAVNDDQLELMNQRYGGGGPIAFFNQFGDIYTPGGGDATSTFVDHLLVTTAGDHPRTADFGQVQVRLVGESTGRPWTTDSLPNLKLDSDEFQDGMRIGGAKHFRLNNAVVGSIYREKLTLDLYRALGYPAPRATYAWVTSNVWGAEVAIPYVLVESYKPQFCKQREEELQGGCVNMWEFPGDFGYGSFDMPESCQFTECDASRVTELEDLVVETQWGDGYKAALSEWIDWDSFHQFQCLSWILATGDDALHNTNNLVLAERADGKFQYLPYSVDISLGQDWYPTVPLPGANTIAMGCQSDAECWADTINTCEALIEDFAAAKPVAMLDGIHNELEREGMLRAGDEDRYEALREYLKERPRALREELELNREQPTTPVYCELPLIDCGGYCAFPEECYVCEPGPLPVPIGEPEPRPGVLAAAQEPADIVIGPGFPPPGDPGPVDPVDGGGVGEPANPGDGGVIEEPPPVDGCNPYVDLY